MNKQEVYQSIDQLVDYALETELISDLDKTWAINSLIDLLNLAEYETTGYSEKKELSEILDKLTDYAIQEGIIEDSITDRDLFDTKIMGVLTPRPKEVVSEFESLYEKSPVEATDWYYDFSNNTNYIRRDRIKKDLKWKTDTEYGPLDITINLSKPEKDPKAIAKAGKMKSTSYPKCQLCIENEGYAGRIDHPARQNHRIIPLKFEDEDWSFQYSPYVYYNEHCIVLNNEHKPMVINRRAMNRLLDFTDQFSHYFVGSNADLPIVGGSILSHEHFQGGHYTFAMENAEVDEEFNIDGYDDVKAGILNWPMSVIRLNSENKEEILDVAELILNKWRGYSDEDVDILAYSDGEPHNTITPIARKHGDVYELDLVLRNNRTTDEYPLGIFHPHQKLHHIKKENIGLIEVMGLAVLPSRLKNEINLIKEVLVNDKVPEDYEELKQHLEWINELKEKYKSFDEETVDSILEDEIGQIFKEVLEDAGVYKRNEEGQKALRKFTASLSD